MELRDVFISMAGKYNQYSQCEERSNQSCKTCVRKSFGFPYTCNDGWPAGDSNWKDEGSTCINWSDNPNCKVD